MESIGGGEGRGGAISVSFPFEPAMGGGGIRRNGIMADWGQANDRNAKYNCFSIPEHSFHTLISPLDHNHQSAHPFARRLPPRCLSQCCHSRSDRCRRSNE